MYLLEFHSYRQDLREEKENIILEYWWPFIGVSHAVEKRVVNKVYRSKSKKRWIHLAYGNVFTRLYWVLIIVVPVSYSYDKLKADDVTKLGSRALGGFSEELVASL